MKPDSGQLPESWQLLNIRRVAQMKTGHTPSRSVPEYWQQCDVPWFTLADVSQLRDGTRTVVSETHEKISCLGLHNSSAELLPAGTVLLSRTASVGFSGIMGTPMATSQDFWNWVCGPLMNPRFLLFAFRALQPYFHGLARGSTHRTIYQDDAASIEVPVPPLALQAAIVEVLDRDTAKIDALIAKQQELVSILFQHQEGVIAGTGAAALAVKGWPIDKLGRRTRIGNGSTPRRDAGEYWTDGSVPWLNSSVVNLPEVNEPSAYVTETAVDECHLPAVRPGSLLVGLTGQGRTRGRATLTRINATINQHLAFVEPSPKHWHAPFLLWQLSSAYAELRTLSDENGSTKGGLTCDDLGRLRVVMPPIQEQQRIAEETSAAMDEVDRLIAKANELIATMKERRAALITAAVTGQLDVATYGRSC